MEMGFEVAVLVLFSESRARFATAAKQCVLVGEAVTLLTDTGPWFRRKLPVSHPCAVNLGNPPCLPELTPVADGYVKAWNLATFFA